MPHAASATERPSGTATDPTDGLGRAASTSSRIRSTERTCGAQVAEDQVGVGDGRSCRRGRSRPGPGRRRRSPGRPAEPEPSTRAMLPPPAPISIRSTTGTCTGSPLPAEAAACGRPRSSRSRGRPSAIRQGLAVVPPMSKAITSRWPAARPKRGRQRPGGRAGLDHPHRALARDLGGRHAAARLHDEERRCEAARASAASSRAEVAPRPAADVGVDHRGRGPLVLADHRARPRRRGDQRRAAAPRASDRGGAPLVGRVGVAVEEADGERLDPVAAEARDGPARAGLVERHSTAPSDADALGDLAAMRAGTSGAGFSMRRS